MKPVRFFTPITGTARTFHPRAMTCAKVQEELRLYINRDPQLTEERWYHIDDHVRTCSECLAEANKLMAQRDAQL